MAAVSRLVVFMARCELARRSQLTKVKVLGTFHVPSTYNPCRCPEADGTTVDPLRFGTLEAWHAIAWGANPSDGFPREA
jgi:hypothetical protein